MSNFSIGRKAILTGLLLLSAAMIGGTPIGAMAAKNDKVAICHIPPDNPGAAHFISVAVSAVPAHLAHGDEALTGNGACSVGLGECPVDASLICTGDGLVCGATPAEPPEPSEASCNDGLDNDCDGLIDGNDSDCGIKITATGEAYGHHGACGGWNGCGDAATCALWACQVNGFSTLVSYGADLPCTQFSVCNLFYDQNNVQMNWGNWCDVQGVTDIVCLDGDL